MWLLLLRKLSLLLLLLFMLQVLLFSFLLLERDMLCTELLPVGADVEK